MSRNPVEYILYSMVLFSIAGPFVLVKSHPGVVLAISGHPDTFYWLAADSAGTPVLMKYGQPGEPSTPYSSQHTGDTHSQVFAPYNQHLKDGGWDDNTPDWTSHLKMELDFIPGPVSVLRVCRLSSHPIDEMFCPHCNCYKYAHDGQKVWPLKITSQCLVGDVVEYGTLTWIVLEQVFGLLGALVAYFTGVAIHRIALPYFSRRGADSG